MPFARRRLPIVVLEYPAEGRPCVWLPRAAQSWSSGSSCPLRIVSILLVIVRDYYQVMKKVNVADPKARLLANLDRAQRGAKKIICRRNLPIAEINPIRERTTVQRPIGIDRGMAIPDSFFDPLPDDLIEAFEGKA